MDKLIIRSIDIKKGTRRKGAKKVRKEETNKREEKMKHKLLRRLALQKKNMAILLIPRMKAQSLMSEHI